FVLEPAQLVVEPVVVGVGDLRVVEDVVAVEMMVELLAELIDPPRDVRGRQGAPPVCRRWRSAPRLRGAGSSGCVPRSRRPRTPLRRARPPGRSASPRRPPRPGDPRPAAPAPRP